MQAKISKTLEAIIARTAFETSKRAITHSLKDFLTLEILREEGSLAHQILTSRLKDWEIHQICLRIESEIRSVSAPDSSRQNPEEFFPLYTRELQRLFAPMHHVSTAHALLHIVSDPHTITSQVLAMYHFDAQAIATELQKMTLEADQRRLRIPIFGRHPNYGSSACANLSGTLLLRNLPCWTNSAPTLRTKLAEAASIPS